MGLQFTPERIQQIIQGTKTQTRRPWKNNDAWVFDDKNPLEIARIFRSGSGCA